MASIGDVVAALRQVADDLPFPALAEALDLAEDAQALVRQVATGSGCDEFPQVVESFQKAAEGIGELQRLLTAIQQSVDGGSRST
ncbi:hypothetical protein [Umezawaea sp. Da 62-37]|uniref:hypothetical protein n=1 Tax=Umezawaea sp. Da 62-37 TaxID=3075927 RepID=UPI0028F721FE|nr:hypothetical protein [Umezawaea sp. Da 62-37]WNV82289.1 hypothetical protein RM788_29255 [Umezawaea sp. Da 62-37]